MCACVCVCVRVCVCACVCVCVCVCVCTVQPEHFTGLGSEGVKSCTLGLFDAVHSFTKC